MHKRLYLLFLLFVSFHTFAQDCDLSITGSVIDLHDDSFLTGAVIAIEGTSKVAYSNLNGKYELKGICPGKITIRITHPYCEMQIKSIDIQENTKLNFRLEHHLEELNEVLLKGKLYEENFNSSITQQLKVEDLESFSNASLGDALSTISGVSSLSTGNAIVKPIINGLHSSRVLIINDNVRLHDQQWGVDHAPNVDINTAANITVIKGASALKYGGDAVGGTIVIEPQRAPVKDTLMGKTILTGATNGRGGTLANSLIKAHLNGFNYRIQGSLKRLGDLRAGDYQLTNTGQRENNISLGIGLNKIDYGFDFSYKLTNSEIGILRAAHVGNITDLSIAINRQKPNFIDNFSYAINNPKQEVTHQIYKLRAFKKWKGVGELSVQYSFQNNNRFEFDVRRTDSLSTIPAMDMNLKTHTVLTQLEWTNPSNFDSEFGLELNSKTNFPDPRTGVRRLIPDYDMYSAGAYATTEYTLNEDWIFDAGIRYDFMSIDAQKFYIESRWEQLNYDEIFPQFETGRVENGQIYTEPNFDFDNLSASLGFTHNFADDWVWSTNLSSASRAPNPSELFSDGLHHSLARIELGELQIDSEQSFKVGTSLQGSINAFQFTIQPYLNFINNFIILEPFALDTTIRGAFPVWQYRQSDSRLYGIDATLSYTYNNFELLSNLAYVNGQDLEFDEPLINMPPFNVSNTVSYRKKEWNNFFVSLNSQLITEQNRFPDDNFEARVINRETGSFEDIEVDISTPPEAYHLLNFQSGMQFDWGEKRLSVNILVNNVLNASYRSYLNALRFYADEVGTNAMLQLKLNY